jgi:DNA-binding HxlR family transcriptional regulator
MERRSKVAKSGCAVEAALAVIGGRWKGVILYWLLGGKKRFGELRRRLPNCSARILTLQLHELKARRPGQAHRVRRGAARVEYELTAFGRSLEGVLRGLKDWGLPYEHRLASALAAASA